MYIFACFVFMHHFQSTIPNIFCCGIKCSMFTCLYIFTTYVSNIFHFCFSLHEECGESVCGPQLTQLNLQISNVFPLITGAFQSVHDYIAVMITGGWDRNVRGRGQMHTCVKITLD